MLAVEHTKDDADVFWIYLVIGIVFVVVIALLICVDGSGHPRKWLRRRMHIRPRD